MARRSRTTNAGKTKNTQTEKRTSSGSTSRSKSASKKTKQAQARDLERELAEARRRALRDEEIPLEKADRPEDLQETSMAQRIAANIKSGGREKVIKREEEDEGPKVEPMAFTTAADLFPIKTIKNGIIYTTDGRYLKIMEVLPTNFQLKGDDEKDSIIYSFEKFLRVAPDKIQIISIAKKTDISNLTQNIMDNMLNEQNEECIELQEDYLSLVEEMGELESVSRRFYLVIQLDEKGTRGMGPKEAQKRLEAMAGTCASYLSECGNECVRPRGDRLTHSACQAYFDILNRYTASEKEFFDRINGVNLWHEQNRGGAKKDEIMLSEYFTPQIIDMRYKDFIKIDDNYQCFLLVPTAGYPQDVYGGWTSLLVNAADGIDVSFYFEKQNTAKMLDKIGRKLRFNYSKIKDVSATTSEFDDVEDAMSAGTYLKEGLRSDDFYYVTTIISISGRTRKEMDYLKDSLVDFLRARGVGAIECTYQEKEAFLSYLPFGKVEPTFVERGKRNVLTSDLASFYPFTSFEMVDDNGVFLGVNEMNSSLVIVDFFDQSKYKNANISVMGTSGAGKTYFLQTLATRLRRNQIQVFIIAPDKGHEFARACENIGGAFINISPASSDCINIMDIRQKDRGASAELDRARGEQSELAEKIQSLHIFFELLIPDIDAEEDQLLDEALIKAYYDKGITHDNDSLFDPENPNKYREMPTLEDVWEILNKDEASLRIAHIMNRLVHGSAKSFNQQTNVPTDNLYTVIDISALTGNLLTVGMYVALDFVYSKAKENRMEKKAIIIDEVWELIGSKSNTKAAEYVLEIFKIIRGYGGSAICATQDLNDFFALEDGKYGKGIINNSKTKIVLNLENKEARAVQELLSLSEDEYQQIIHFQRGHGLLSTNGNNIPIHFRTSDTENALITTDREQLRSLTNRKNAPATVKNSQNDT